MSTSALTDPSRRVPVEHRVLGLDRRSFGLALTALVIYALWAWVMPWIDRQVAWDDPIRAGDSIQVTKNVTMTPPVGWGLAAGLRTSDKTNSGETAANQTVLYKDGITLSIITGPFDGTPARLVRQAERITGTGGDFKVLTDARTTTTSGNLKGVVEGFQSQRLAGILAGFVVDGTGIEIQIVGPPDQMSQQAATIGRTLDTLTSTNGSNS